MDIPDSDVKTPVFKGDVLVCEDNETSRKIIQKQLSNVGLNAVIVPNGKKGIMLAGKRLSEGTPFDLILTNYHMPEMDGPEMAEALTAMGSDTPVVIISSDSHIKCGGRHVSAHISGYLIKPYKLHELWTCLNNHLAPAESKEIKMNGYTHDFSILIVDDDQSGLEVLQQILSPYYTIYTAISGKSALKMVEALSPDLIILDIIMQDMNGFDVLIELKKSEATNKIPVIFITGIDNTESEEKGLFLGAVDYITKPFHSSIIKARIMSQLRIVKHIRSLERFGLIDTLTELPNRRSFDNHLEIEWGRAIRDEHPLSALMMDIDNFKHYNDTYGHQQGDVVLQSIAQVLTETVKRATDLVFRWGGEEFMVLLPNTDLNGGVRVAENIRENVEALAIPHKEGKTTVTVSIGVASEQPVAGSKSSELISRADKFLYDAKAAGKNKVSF